MEPIRYLQPATFPPPAFNCSTVKCVLRRKKCSHDNNESIDVSGNSNSSSKKHLKTYISGNNCSSHNTHTNTATYLHEKESQNHHHHQHTYRQNYRYSNIFWCLAFVILMCCCNQAVNATPIFVDSPNLAQFQTGRNIRHLPCIVRKSGLSGTCMFAIDCIKQNGTHLGTCIDRFYFGSCCQIKEEKQDFAPEISDNSIDQNTILHFVPEVTTLPTSAHYRPSTETQQQQHKINNNNSSSNINNHITNTKYTTTPLTTSSLTTDSKKPTKVTSTATSTQQTKKPVANSNSTHKNSQFVVRTTKKPITTKTTTTRHKPTTATTTTTQEPKTTTTSQATRKPSRRKPTTTTTTTPSPVLTTDGPRLPGLFETTISPPKLFTFQMVETTTPTQTESTNFIDYTTLPPLSSTTHHKQPQRPTIQSTTQEHKNSEVTSIITTVETSTAKVKPSPPIRHTTKPKPTIPSKPLATTLPQQTVHPPEKTRKPTPTKKAATKRPKPTTLTTTLKTTSKPVPLADEIPPTVNTHHKPSTTAASSHIHTTHPQTTRPKPISTATKTPGSTIISTTINQHRKPTPETAQTLVTTKRPKPKPTKTTTTEKPLPSSIATKATSTTFSPKIASTTTTVPTTFKPGLITWTNEGAEPIINTTLTSDQQQWLPVPTIAPETLTSTKHEITTSAPKTSASTTTIKPIITTSTSTSTDTTLATVIMSSTSTEKIIVSVSSSVSEVHKNETRLPERPQPTKPPPRPVKPQTQSAATTSKLPTTPTKPILSTTTTAPIDMDSTTLDYEGTVDSSTDINWGSSTTGFMTEGVTEDYNATLMMGTPTATTLPPTPANLLEGVDYKQICGRRMFPEPRVVGGSNAAFGRWPWQISLRQWRTSTYLHKCGAALLNENWAITAAHCVDNVPPSDLLLRLGEYDLAEEEEPYGYQERRVQIVASHPQFDPRTFEYDLALLRFYEPVVFQPNIIPVCVPNSDEDFIGQTAFVTGWGRLYEDGPLPSVLQEVAVPVINNSICETMYRAAGYIEHIPHIFICAGWKKGGYDSCEGDSGGPMVLQREDDKRFQLGGVISWGIGCAEANQPGVYTRISEFRDWINQILQF